MACPERDGWVASGNSATRDDRSWSHPSFPSGNRSRVDGTADRVVRVLYAEQTGESEKIRNILQELAVLDDLAGDDEFRFEDTDEGWRLHSAA